MKKFIIFLFLIFIFSCTKNNEEDFFDTQCDSNNVYYFAEDTNRSISNIISNKCLSCHSANNSGGIVNLETYENLIQATNLLYRINLDSSHPLVMPQVGSPQLTDCEKTQIANWVNNNHPYDEAQR